MISSASAHFTCRVALAVVSPALRPSSVSIASSRAILLNNWKNTRLRAHKFSSSNTSAFKSSESVAQSATVAESATLKSTSAASGRVGNAGNGAAAAVGGGSEGGRGALNKAGSIFFPSLCLLTFGLGTWQTVRYFEKIDMVKKREDDLSMVPFGGYEEWLVFKTNSAVGGISGSSSEIEKGSKKSNEATKDVSNKSYRRVNLRGKFLHEHELLIGPRGPPPGALSESGPNSGRGGGGGMSSSMQGYWVITPLVLVNQDHAGDDDNAVARVEEEEVGAKGMDVDVHSQSKKRWFQFWGVKSNNTNNATPSSDIGSASESSTSTDSSSKSKNNKEQTIVWINRGWIPRHFVNTNNAIATTWERPDGVVELMAMESETETPGTFTPPSRLETTRNTNGNIQQLKNQLQQQQPQQSVKKLLWMDRQAMKELTNCPEDSQPHLFVQIHKDSNGNIASGKLPQYPVKPPQEYVGEFKVTPEVHAGYAFTWFGLSGAGMVMTRKLLGKVR